MRVQGAVLCGPLMAGGQGSVVCVPHGRWAG